MSEDLPEAVRKLLETLNQKAQKLGRTAFITHIDGQKLCGKGYETEIWVHGDIDEILEAATALLVPALQSLGELENWVTGKHFGDFDPEVVCILEKARKVLTK
jgi:hypothetical protein